MEISKEQLDKLRHALVLADEELDSCGYSSRHIVRAELKQQIEVLNQLEAK